eukprot:5345435-Alexandrium_andersonii.AAC.1
MDVIWRTERAAQLWAHARVVEEGGRVNRVKLRPRAHPRAPQAPRGVASPPREEQLNALLDAPILDD